MNSRREEYTKRFEELTKQEIKNYNDSLLATHSALEEFRRNLKGSIDLYANQVAHLSSQIKKLEADNIDLKDIIKNITRKLESQTRDCNNIEMEKIGADRKRLKWEMSIEDGFFKLKNAVLMHEDATKSEFTGLKDHANALELKIENTYRKSISNDKALKEEILSLPSEALKVKDELLKKISEASVDAAGIQRELEKIKSKSVIQESMNEYFHNQLGRLKKRDETKNTEVLRG